MDDTSLQGFIDGWELFAERVRFWLIADHRTAPAG